MSSTYGRRIRQSPISNFITNTQWSGCVLWYPWLTMKDSNFRYHFQGVCFSQYRLFVNRNSRFSFPFFMILLVAAYRFLPLNHHREMSSWHSFVWLLDLCWLLCTTLLGWMSSSLLMQRFRQNPLPSSNGSPSRLFGPYILVNFCHLLVSSCNTHWFSTLFPFGNSVSSYMWFSCKGASRLSWSRLLLHHLIRLPTDTQPTRNLVWIRSVVDFRLFGRVCSTTPPSWQYFFPPWRLCLNSKWPSFPFGPIADNQIFHRRNREICWDFGSKFSLWSLATCT